MGMVRQWQELLHAAATRRATPRPFPIFVKLADAFGAVGRRVEDPAELDDAIREMLAIDRAVILDVAVDPAENCFPMIPSGAPITRCCSDPRTRPRSPSPRRAWCSSEAGVIDIERHTIAVLVDNEPGILARVVGPVFRALVTISKPEPSPRWTEQTAFPD